jgi:hypothetical protein
LSSKILGTNKNFHVISENSETRSESIVTIITPTLTLSEGVKKLNFSRPPGENLGPVNC